MSLRRFTNVKNLRSLGRPLLRRFFDRFSHELSICEANLPADSLADDSYFIELAKVFLSPKDLPQELTQVLYAAVELADDKGVLELLQAVKEKGLAVECEKEATNLDIVIQVWLADADLMIQKHNEHRLLSTTQFQYWGTKTSPGNRFVFKPPTADAIEFIRQAVDDWCKENHRGENTVVITPHEIESEWWFLIQHGGTMSRLAESKGNQRTETMFYRPGKDDVVVYNTERDELRIHAGTNKERDLYREEFGLRLRGDRSYFCQRKNFDLETLRRDVALALNPEGVAEIEKIVLQELEIAFGGEYDDRTIRKSDDIVASAALRSNEGKSIPPVPAAGTLVRAVFEIQFVNCKKPRRVTLRPPDVLKVGRQGDLKAVHDWLSLRGFRAGDNS